MSQAEAQRLRFDQLWKASLLASLLPLITVVALFHFIPDVKQGDPVVDPGQTATKAALSARIPRVKLAKDSLWKRFWSA